MKVTKRQLRRIIKEERASLLTEQTPRGNPNKPWDAVFPPGKDGGSAVGSDVGNTIAAGKMADFIAPMIADAWWEDVASEEYEGTGPTWSNELEEAREELTDALISTGALKAVTDLIASVDERLHNGEFAR